MGNASAAKAPMDHLLAREQWQLAEFTDLFSLPGVDYRAKVYPDWSAKDVLAHVMFWHESFARNLAALAFGEEPSPPRWTLRETNRISVDDNRKATKAALLRRLLAAQATIERHIGDESVGLIPYRRGSRPYARAEYLEVVTGHIRDHHWHVVRALITGRII